MEPITGALVIGGAQLVAGLMGLWQAEKARGAEESRLREIEELFNTIKPPEYKFKIQDPPELVNNLVDDKRFNAALNARYTPQVAQLIEEKAPELLKETPESKVGLDAQKRALEEYQRISEGQEDPRFKLLVDRAKKSAQGQAQSRQDSLMQSMARRGLGGSGIDLAAQIGSSAESMDRLADVEQQAASDAYRNRLDALSQGATLGRNMRTDEMSMQEKNLNLINDFNKRNSLNRQTWENQRANTANEGQAKNIGLDQWKYGAGEANQARNNIIAQGKAEWMRGERGAEEDARQRDYDNKLRKAALSKGLSAERGANDMSATRDRITAGGGLMDALAKTATKGLDYWDEQRKKKKLEEEEV